MGKCTFVGCRHVSYTAKDGRKVEGFSLYFTEERDGVEGVACFDAFVSPSIFDECFACVPIGSDIELMYNRYGKICGCSNATL